MHKWISESADDIKEIATLSDDCAEEVNEIEPIKKFYIISFSKASGRLMYVCFHACKISGYKSHNE